MKPPLLHSRRILCHSLILGLILLAAWLRLWQLNSIPPGLWFDEAYYAMDAVWMRETNTWSVFLLGNNGREAMFSWLLSLFTAIWGETVYVVRLGPALLGTLSIPLMYRWILTLFRTEANIRWLALVSTAGLTTSFWYVVMNRSGYRANLLPLFILIVSYFFWRGWQTGNLRHYLLAGVGLGLCQYTYLSARLLPLVFVLFLFIQTGLFWKEEQARLKAAWLRLFCMAGVSIIVSTPLLLSFVDYPEAFWGRVGDVTVKVGWSAEDLKALGLHLLAAIRVFVDGEDPNWRHHLIGRPVFDWFSTLGFWVGLVIAVRHYRQANFLFPLILLSVMWLPAPLSEPAFHTLRLSGILPAYYVFVALGVFNIVNWAMARFGSSPRSFVSTPSRASFVALIAVLVLSGGVNFYDYFFRWAKTPEVYAAYEASVVDLANFLTAPHPTNLIIPFYLYTHASIRYLLHDTYQEKTILPTDVLAGLRQHQKVSVIIPEYPPADGEPPAFVWLLKDGAKPGMAYVSEVGLTELKLELVGPLKGNRSNIIAQEYQVKTEAALALFLSEPPHKTVAFEWADNLRLIGYEFAPTAMSVDAVSTLHLSWKILGYTGLQEKMFIQLLDSEGNPVGQKELDPISRKMYRWRKDGLILEQYPLDFGADLKPGLYFVRLGFFNPKTYQRLTMYDVAKQPMGDEVILGPLYVYDKATQPMAPQHLVRATLGKAIEILGYSISSGMEGTSSTEIKVYWQTRMPIDKNYTVFVQLLDAQNKVIAQHDHQPLNGLFPTASWQPDDIVVDKFILSVSIPELLSDGHKLVTGMYDLSTGVRLPAYNHKGELLPDGLIKLVN